LTEAGIIFITFISETASNI